MWPSEVALIDPGIDHDIASIQYLKQTYRFIDASRRLGYEIHPRGPNRGLTSLTPPAACAHWEVKSNYNGIYCLLSNSLYSWIQA
jgi:hypothetical protein